MGGRLGEADLAQNASVRELVGQLGVQVAQLMRDEFALAKAELFAQGRQGVMGSGMLAAAALLGLTGWLALVAAGIAGIAVALPVWAASLIIGGALLLAAGFLAARASRRLSRGAPPLQRTAQSIRADVQEIMEKARNDQQAHGSRGS